MASLGCAPRPAAVSNATEGLTQGDAMADPCAVRRVRPSLVLAIAVLPSACGDDPPTQPEGMGIDPRWSAGVPVPLRLTGAAAVEFGGGSVSRTCPTSAFSGGWWSLPTLRSQAAEVAVGNRIYVIGGRSARRIAGGALLKAVLIYDAGPNP